MLLSLLMTGFGGYLLFMLELVLFDHSKHASRKAGWNIARFWTYVSFIMLMIFCIYRSTAGWGLGLGVIVVLVLVSLPVFDTESGL